MSDAVDSFFPRCKREGLKIITSGMGLAWVDAKAVENLLEKQMTDKQLDDSPVQMTPQVFNEADFGRLTVRDTARGCANHANDIFRERSQVVYGPSSADGPANWNEQRGLRDTHVGYLVGVQPIVRDTAESLLAEWVRRAGDCHNPMWESMDEKQKFCERAKKLLERGG